MDTAPTTAPNDAHYVFRFKEKQSGGEFGNFYQEWNHDTLCIYRGFNCSHFAYPGILTGTLRSEGDADNPTFTMGNDQKTRWLPGCFVRNLCEGVAISGTDQHTMSLSITAITRFRSPSRSGFRPGGRPAFRWPG